MPIRPVQGTEVNLSATAAEETPFAPRPRRRIRPATHPDTLPAEPGPADEEESMEYKVGKGKPPLHTRFRKGQSGNPNGRPGGSKNEKTLIKEILGKRIPVRTPDGKRRLNSFEISLIKLREKAAQGDIRAIREVLAYLGKISAANEQDAANGRALSALTPAEEQILQYLLGGGQDAGVDKEEASDD